MDLNAAARAAYEACPDQPHKRVPWENLTEFWHDYWKQIARAVLSNAGVPATQPQQEKP